MNAIKKSVFICLLIAGVRHELCASETSGEQVWPHPIPCRIGDGSNPELFVMTLGNIETPIADGTFDPLKDEVRLKDGSVKTNYYRDTLGVKFYQPLDKSRFALPPSGWCTWYYYYNRINADEIGRNAEWISAYLKDYGAQYVQIDDGWQGSGEKGSARNWDAINTNRFPNGLAAVAKHIKSLGLTPGIWIAPHGQNNDDVVKSNPGVFLLKPDGTTASDTWEGRFLLDPTAPGSDAYLRQLFTRLSGWGYDYFKIDGQPIVVEEYGAKTNFMKSPKADAARLYRQTLESIRGAIGPDRYLLGCWGIPLEGAGIMNGSRTGGDIVLGWGGFQVALRPTLEFFYLHNIVWYSDPDVVLVRSPLTLDQARVWATLQGLTGQAVMSSDRLMDLGEERVELLRRIYPATDIRPLDLFPTERNKRIWDLKVNHLDRLYDVVGVFNFDSDKADQVYLSWKDLGLVSEKPVHVFDFWNKEYLGAWAEGMAVPTAPTSCRVLTLVPDNGRIQLISTSRHITQGPVELMKLSQSGDAFKGMSRLIRNDPYQLSFAFPRGTNYTITRAVARSGSMEMPVKIANHQGWAVLEIDSSKTQDVDWEVEFAPADSYRFPPSAPEHLFVRSVGLDGASLNWREQYYLNNGYQVYLDGRMLGQTPEAKFSVRNLDPSITHTARVTTVSDSAVESPRSAETTFNLATLAPRQLLLTQLQPEVSTGRWEGYEIEELLADAPLSIAGQRYERGLKSFSGSETEFNLHGLYDTFAVQIGIDDESRADAGGVFIVVADGKEVWRSERLKKGDKPVAINVAIGRVRKLTLKTLHPGEGERHAQMDWIHPEVSRSRD